MNNNQYIFLYLFNRLFKFDPSELHLYKRVLGKWTNYKYKDGVFSLNWNGYPIALRENSSDLEVFNQVFLRQEYSFCSRLYEKYFSDYEVKSVIDAGANIGLSAIYFKNLYPNAKVFAIEPDKDNFKMLISNTKNLEGLKNLHIGLWDEDKEIIVSDEFRDGASWSKMTRSIHDGDDDSNRVNGTKLITFFRMQKLNDIDILKIDIEGAEHRVLMQDSDSRIVLESTKICCIEIHKEFSDVFEFRSYFKNLGFDLFSCAGSENIFGVNTRLIKATKNNE